MIDPEVSEAQPPTTDRMLRQFAALWILVLGGLAGGSGSPAGTERWPWSPPGWASCRDRRTREATDDPASVRRPDGHHLPDRLGGLARGAGRPVLGVFTPVAVLFRLIGRDALARRRPPDRAPTGTEPVPDDVRSYFRQS